METTRQLFEAHNKGMSQLGRPLKLDTTLGKDVLLPHRLADITTGKLKLI